ncbi:TPR and ankyrin repeat-containing protein 1-like isoform X2 [Patagioenas fasciata]|uniref:TPR and ankyrin repeat-containing protein 1-like isoform X2 n=1 Tax=Patagioenas fasciata TaxID=372321 RepID=UPI003A994411
MRLCFMGCGLCFHPPLLLRISGSPGAASFSTEMPETRKGTKLGGGALHQASGVPVLLQYYFPESFDRLPEDWGLFDGRKPTVLGTLNVSGLSVLLGSHKKKTPPVEFGACQEAV